MKKYLFGLIIICLLLPCFMLLTGCEHSCHAVQEWRFDENGHWLECEGESCDKQFDVGNHSGGDATFTQKAICTICGASYGMLKDKLQSFILDVKMSSKIYDGQPADLPTFDKVGNGEVAIEWWQSETKLPSIPKDVGNYKVKITIADTESYRGCSVEKDFVISKAKVQPITKIASKVYNGKKQVAEVVSNSLYKVVNDGGTEAGSYNVLLQLKDKINYCWIDDTVDDKKLTFAITKEIVTLPTITSKIYNGNLQIADIPTSNLYNVINNGGIHAGKYDVVFSLADKDNYSWADDTTQDKVLQFAIEKAKIDPITSVSSKVYNGTLQTADIPQSNFYDVVNDGGINAGSYDVKICLKDKTNYIWSDDTSDDKVLAFVIQRATLPPVSFKYMTNAHFLDTVCKVMSSDVLLIYNGNYMFLDIPSWINKNDIIVSYFLQDGTPLAEAPTIAGSYLINIEIVSSANYTSATMAQDLDNKFEIMHRYIDNICLCGDKNI